MKQRSIALISKLSLKSSKDLFHDDARLFFWEEIPMSHVLGVQICGATCFFITNTRCKIPTGQFYFSHSITNLEPLDKNTEEET